MKALLKTLSEAYGPSGAEGPVRELVRAEIRKLADHVTVDALGNLIAVHKKQGEGGRKIMLVAHLDEIGFVVTHVDAAGFARVQPYGGINPLACVGQRVRFANGRLGVLGLDARRDDMGKIPALSEMYIDVGAADRASALTLPGEAAWAPTKRNSPSLTAKRAPWIAGRSDPRKRIDQRGVVDAPAATGSPVRFGDREYIGPVAARYRIPVPACRVKDSIHDAMSHRRGRRLQEMSGLFGLPAQERDRRPEEAGGCPTQASGGQVGCAFAAELRTDGHIGTQSGRIGPIFLPSVCLLKIGEFAKVRFHVPGRCSDYPWPDPRRRGGCDQTSARAAAQDAGRAR